MSFQAMTNGKIHRGTHCVSVGGTSDTSGDRDLFVCMGKVHMLTEVRWVSFKNFVMVSGGGSFGVKEWSSPMAS